MSPTLDLQPITTLEDYVLRATTVYRKEEMVKHTTIGRLDVVTIDNFPELPAGLRSTVDCHFVTIGFTEALAQWTHRQFYDAVLAAEHGVFSDMAPVIWNQGPSYITIGGWIGDQTTAFRFMACVQAHGLGHIITPATLGITDQVAADAMAGGGMILLSGLKEPS